MMNYLPSKLNKLRKHYNYSQQYLADKLGVDVVEYMGYENGNSMINYSQMRKLASVYHVSMNEMFKNSDDVELQEIKEDTDEINASYFMTKNNIKNRIKGFIINHKIATSIIGGLLIAIIILSIILNNLTRPYTINRENINRLSVSKTTVIYIDDSGAIGFSGSNSNGQLNDLAITGATKVCEGDGFTVVLDENGNVYESGLISEHAKKVKEWKNIVDIDAGNKHVVAVDANGKVYCAGDSEACEIEGIKNIKKVFASANASIVMNEAGVLTYKGTLIGSSYLKEFNNILDIASSDNILVVLNNDKTLNVYSKNGSYIKSETWEDIVDVTCGDDFVAALDSYGKVYIEIDNDDYTEQVGNWSNIVAIDAGKNYLIGFDGKNIYGIGNNDYNQFSKEEKQKITLEEVKNINYTIDRDNIYVQFDGVNNATRYLVSLNVGTGLSKRINDNEVVEFSTDNMIEGKTYTISVIAEGSGEYKDSNISEKNFIFNRPKNIDVNVSNFLGKNKNELEEYLKELDVTYSFVEDETVPCDVNRDKIVAIEGLNDGQYSKEELSTKFVTIRCCKVVIGND